MHFLKIKDSSLHQDGKGMCCWHGLNILKCFESINFDNRNDLLIIKKGLTNSFRVVII